MRILAMAILLLTAAPSAQQRYVVLEITPVDGEAPPGTLSIVEGGYAQLTLTSRPTCQITVAIQPSSEEVEFSVYEHTKNGKRGRLLKRFVLPVGAKPAEIPDFKIFQGTAFSVVAVRDVGGELQRPRPQ